MSLKDIPERLSHAEGNAGSLWQMGLKAADLLDFVLIVRGWKFFVLIHNAHTSDTSPDMLEEHFLTHCSEKQMQIHRMHVSR